MKKWTETDLEKQLAYIKKSAWQHASEQMNIAEKKRRSNIESDENGIRRKKTRYVAKAQIDEQNNQE